MMLPQPCNDGLIKHGDLDEQLLRFGRGHTIDGVVQDGVAFITTLIEELGLRGKLSCRGAERQKGVVMTTALIFDSVSSGSIPRSALGICNARTYTMNCETLRLKSLVLVAPSVRSSKSVSLP